MMLNNLPKGIFKQIIKFSSGYFQNYGHKTTCLELVLEFLKLMTVLVSVLKLPLTVMNHEVNTFLHIIGI